MSDPHATPGRADGRTTSNRAATLGAQVDEKFSGMYLDEIAAEASPQEWSYVEGVVIHGQEEIELRMRRAQMLVEILEIRAVMHLQTSRAMRVLYPGTGASLAAASRLVGAGRCRR